MACFDNRYTKLVKLLPKLKYEDVCKAQLSCWEPRQIGPQHISGCDLSLKAYSNEGSEKRRELPWIFKWNREGYPLCDILNAMPSRLTVAVFEDHRRGLLENPLLCRLFKLFSPGQKWNKFSFSLGLKLIRTLSCYGGTHQKQDPWPTFGVSIYNMMKYFTLAQKFNRIVHRVTLLTVKLKLFLPLKWAPTFNFFLISVCKHANIPSITSRM